MATSAPTFATPADLLARSNARGLAQLAAPADHERLDDGVLRAAIEGEPPAEPSGALALALGRIDTALHDATALMVSYGVRADAQSPLLARMCSTIALYNLYDSGRMDEDVQRAYDGVLETLARHSKGTVNLTPSEDGDASADAGLDGGMALIVSSPSRYARRTSDLDED